MCRCAVSQYEMCEMSRAVYFIACVLKVYGMSHRELSEGIFHESETHERD